jgi:hypothetical protein
MTTQMMEEVNQEESSDDQIIKEIDVYVSKRLDGKIYVLQVRPELIVSVFYLIFLILFIYFFNQNKKSLTLY